MLDIIFYPTPTFNKWDKSWVGSIPGLFGPFLGIFLFYAWKYSDISFVHYLHIATHPSVISPMLSLGVVINLFIFFPFVWNDYYNAARGVIGATILYSIPILIYKFL